MIVSWLQAFSKEGDAVTNESILISEVIPATPQRIFSAWMDSAEHSAFTGDEATVVPEIGGELRVAGGYIQGRTLELNEGSRIVHSWRTTEFPPDSPDSRVEITLEPTLGGTLVTLLHTDIPVGQGDRYRQGWNEYYLSRLKSYFSDGEITAETPVDKAAGGHGMNADVDLDEETSVGDLEPTSVVDAPTRIMKTRVKRLLAATSRGAKPGSTGDTATVRLARSAAPARESQAKAKPVRAAASAAKASSKASSKKRAKAKARRPAKAVKAAARRPARKSAAKVSMKMSPRRAAKKPAKAKKVAKRATATAARKMGVKAKRPTKKKASSSARSRR
jgi:uncharacterized protein YndB with AHSA1/START domain